MTAATGAAHCAGLPRTGLIDDRPPAASVEANGAPVAPGTPTGLALGVGHVDLGVTVAPDANLPTNLSVVVALGEDANLSVT